MWSPDFQVGQRGAGRPSSLLKPQVALQAVLLECGHNIPRWPGTGSAVQSGEFCAGRAAVMRRLCSDAAHILVCPLCLARKDKDRSKLLNSKPHKATEECLAAAAS